MSENQTYKQDVHERERETLSLKFKYCFYDWNIQSTNQPTNCEEMFITQSLNLFVHSQTL